AKAASRIGRFRDPGRPRKLNEEQRREVRQDPVVLGLSSTRDRLRDRIVEEFGAVKLAIGEPIHGDYEKVAKMLTNAIDARERAMLKQVKARYDKQAPLDEIQRQLHGE